MLEWLKGLRDDYLTNKLIFRYTVHLQFLTSFMGFLVPDCTRLGAYDFKRSEIDSTDASNNLNQTNDVWLSGFHFVEKS